MNPLIILFIITLSWVLKLLVGFLAYHLCMWIGTPEWATITVTACTAASTYFKLTLTNEYTIGG